MGLDRELTREAQVAREQLAVSQHAAERARADYHRAIRRLHAAGGSLREIADALGLSHQRVHQIIDEATEPTRPRGGGAHNDYRGGRGRARSVVARARSAPS